MNFPKPIQAGFFAFMKITFIQICLALTFSALSYAYDMHGQQVLEKRIYLEVKNEYVNSVLKKIERQAGVTFTYNGNLIKRYNRVTVAFDSLRLDEALDRLFNYTIAYEVVDNQVILRPYKRSSIDNNNAESGVDNIAIQISGRVTDENNQPLPGVNILEKGTTNGTTADADGRYSLSVAGPSSVLVYSFIGYASQEIEVGQQTTIDLSLIADIQSLGEVVIVGYGEQERTKLTGAVGEINAQDIIQNPSINVSNTLVGRVPGLISVQRTGEPGSDQSQLFIRGVGTNGISDPLYVIDGIPRSASDFFQINPNEIESVNILKDAASAAVFGVRGGNGVVLVTTKRGTAGKPILSYSFNYGIQRATRLPEYLGSYDYALLKNESLRNVGQPELYSAEQLEKFRDGSDPDRFPNTDWLDLALKKTAPQQQHNLGLSGGNEKTKYFVNLGYAQQEAIYKSDQNKFERFNIRSNIDVAATKTTHIQVDLSGRLDKTTVPSSGMQTQEERLRETFEEIFTRLPVTVARFQNGYYSVGDRGGNPLVRLDERSGYIRDQQTQFLGTLTLTQELPFVEGLSIKGVAAYDRGQSSNKRWGSGNVSWYSLNAAGEYINQNPRPIPSLSQQMDESERLTLESHLNYERTFGEHNLSVLLLYSQQSYNDSYINASRNGFVSPAIDQLGAGGTENQLNNGGASETAIQGAVGRLNYDYLSKYLLEASFRYDGSANFPKDQRWGFFPSVSAGWVLSRESFLENVGFLEFLKLKGSIGLLGNDRLPVGGFFHLGRYNFGEGYPFGSNLATDIVQGPLPNPNITWEKIRKINIGIETRLFEGALFFEANYFYDHRTDILGRRQISVPATFGAELPVENIATIDNRGVELTLTHQRRISDDLAYSIGSNFTFVRNKQVFLDEPNYADTTAAYRNRQTGRPLNQQFGYKAIGFFQSQPEIDGAPNQFGINNLQPGDIRYEDINGDGKIDAEDIIQIGRSTVPEIVFGISGGVTFRNFEFNFLFQGAANADVNYVGYMMNLNEKYLEENLDRWTSETPDAEYPRLAANGSSSFTNNRQNSSFWMKDVSYLRLKNVEIAYNVPTSVASKIRATNLRIYANGSNLLTFSKVKNIDPENAANNGLTYPQQQIFNFGLNVQF